MAIKPKYFLIILALSLSACGQGWSQKQKKSNDKFDYGADIEKMVQAMSIEEKVGQMTQINLDVISVGEIYNLKDPHELDPVKLDSAINHYYVGSVLNVGGRTYSREHWEEIITELQEVATNEGNKIPVIYGIDAIHGVNYTMGATLFPQEIGQAATWNPDLVRQAAAITAYECRASGIPWNFSPVLDLGRMPLWSRFFETYGEDVVLAKAMTDACIQGYQGGDASSQERVAACMKHFLGYSLPRSGKDRTPVYMDQRELREYYLPTFEAAIEQEALTVMINSGELNGIPVHSDPEILTTLLRDELSFKGLAVTDWEDIIKLHRDHRVAKDMREAVKMAVMAGVDMSMTPNDYSFNKALIDLVKKGEVPESRLDESCRRILWVKKELGLFEKPAPDFDSYTKFGSKEYKQASETAAAESMTLLKNDDNILPLKADQKVLLCGPAANSLNLLNGAWTHTWQGVDPQYNTKGAQTVLEAMKAKGGSNIMYAEGSGLTEEKDIANAVKQAGSADVIVVCLGELPSTEKPGDIEDLELPAAQKNLVKALSETGKPIVLALVFNRPLLVRDIEPMAAGVVHCYLPGDYGAPALTDVLYGDVNPSGKLPFTYPRYSGSLVPYDHKYMERMDKDFGKNAFNPQWQFGEGMSYSTFEYGSVKLDKSSYGANETIKVSVSVKNTSNRTGKEVVQVYVSDLVATVTPSVKRLRAFDKVELAGGESKTVSLDIPVQDLAFVGRDLKWTVEPGDFELSVAGKKVPFTVK